MSTGRGRHAQVALLLLLACHAAWRGSSDSASQPHPVPLVLPVPGNSQLAVQAEGIALLNSLTDPVAPVVVIGPYRSGKSFTLNQILGVPCNQGFGVGHTRDTQTKGIWLWSQPQPKPMPDGKTVSVLFIDTEGFESTGKSNSYDDRIFAVSSLLSSVLIYNLPETIRESDIAKLSFAVELAQGLYDRQTDEGQQQLQQQGGDAGTAGQEQGGGAFAPGAMLWLIQRDFLQGRSAADLVAQVLAPVPNPKQDPDLSQLNHIRTSLVAIAANSTGYSLTQPHLERTRLCELTDAELDPKYVQQRDGLRQLVKDMARPKMVAGRPYSGRQLAALLQQLVLALNSQEIPNVASMLEVFNRDLVTRCVRSYRAALEALRLPMDEGSLGEAESTARAAALRQFSASAVGPRHKHAATGSGGGGGGGGGVERAAATVAGLEGELLTALDRELHVKSTENQAASDALCSELESKCESELDALQGMRLPSVRTFNATFRQCSSTFETRCLGPAKRPFQERLTKAFVRSQTQFSKDYNDRLYTGLLFLSLALALAFRFLAHIRLLEAVSWLTFVFLELYPHVAVGHGSMYDTHWWHATVRVWEMLMCVLFGFRGAWAIWVVVVGGGLGYREYVRRQGTAGGRRGKKGRAPSGYAHSTRDLDV